MMPGRRQDWEQRLTAHIEGFRTKAYEPGKFDCFQMARGGVLAVTGRSILTKLTGYKTELGGYKKLKKQGFETISDAFASALFEHQGFPQRGYIAIIENPDQSQSAGIVMNQGIWVKNSDNVTQYSVDQAIRIFRVG